MFRFRLGSIPIEVHFSHLAISALIGMMVVEKGFADGDWPAHNESSKLTDAACVALWMVMVSVSVLVHELGHALVSRVFGYRPTVHLIGMGGLTHPNANETIPWHRDVLLTIAGPLAGLSLGLVAGVGYLVSREAGVAPGPLTYALLGLLLANLLWALLNLLPVSSFDGGRISSALLIRIFGRQGFLFAQLLSLAVSLAVIVFTPTDLLLVLIIGFSVVRSMASVHAYFKGQLPPEGPTHPFELAFLQAESRYKEGKLEEAGKLLAAVEEHELQPQLRARVHDLSGWVAVKLGEGRRALDHFAQVQGLTVAPQALAAAFSLIADETRALPLWEQAAKTSRDPTLLHEWAGALIRDGKADTARGIPGVRMALAYAAAARTLFVRKAHLEAAGANEGAFSEEPTPERAYDAACAWALAGRPDEALRMLQAASKTGPVRADQARWDPELVSLQNDPRFLAWLAGLK